MEKHQAVASELQKGNSLYHQGDYGAAMECYKYIADKYKNAVAMTKVGDMYSLGLGTAQDYGAAMAWYKKAADAGDSNAMSKLGDMYRCGQGVEEDHKMALVWYRKAAAAGETYAMTRAIEIHEKAAAAGDSYAMFRLGDIYSSGHGGELDYEKAKEWYRQAALAGEVRAAHKLINLYKQAANTGDARAMHELGELHSSGIEVLNIEFSTEWLERTDDEYISEIVQQCRKRCEELSGGPDSEEAIGDALREVCPDARLERYNEAAIKWLEKAANSGYTPAMNRLGKMMYKEGTGIKVWGEERLFRKPADERNPELCKSAFRWFKRAARLGDTYALATLGHLYFLDLDSGLTDDERALEWCRKLAAAAGNGLAARKVVDMYEEKAEKRDSHAIKMLGDIYCSGVLIDKDYKKAFEWYKKEFEIVGGIAEELLFLAERVKQWNVQHKLDYATAAKLIAECYKLAVDATDSKGIFWLWEFNEEKISAENISAIYKLGTMYYSGTGVKENKNKAFSLYERVIRSSEDPLRDSHTRELIFKIYRREADRGNLRALGKLGDLYYLGWGTELNYEEAIKWYEAAGEAGLGRFARIGDMYCYGTGVDRDYKKAREWYEKGAVKGEVKAMLALADMYFLGLGVEKNYKKYLEWHEKADEKIIP